jgi:peptide/histidine transporter 3/4
LIEPVSSPETQPLLSPLQSSSGAYINFRERLVRVNCLPRGLCLPSKAAVLILIWTLIVSAIYKTAEEGTTYAVYRLKESEKTHFHFLAVNHSDIFLTYLIFVLLLLVYPVAGFVADVCCGRYRAVIISLCFLLCGLACLALVTILLFTHVIRNPFDRRTNISQNSNAFFALSSLGFLLLIPGLSGYQANFIQLGLDQLLEAPCEYLGLFVHWVEWFTELGNFLTKPVFYLLAKCSNHLKFNLSTHHTVLSLSPFFFIILLLVLIFSYWKRRWFYSEPGQNNPYKTVFKVLNFARKHKYPVQRSAFTYADDEEPTRIDFAKERYGGPFTTEQVEDVKTFLRILLVLLLLGPAFALEIPLGPIFYLYTTHVGKSIPKDECSVRLLLQDTAILRSLIVVSVFPIYVWLIYSVLRRCIPKILVRIWTGELLLVTGMTAMFLIDLFGHVAQYERKHQSAMCMFAESKEDVYQNHSSNLNLPWAVNLIPAFLMQAGITLVITTSYEFISAQSPHSMKGLLIGLLFAIQGIFKFLGAMSIIPFSLKGIWEDSYMQSHLPSITNCGFGYLLLNCTIALISLVLFTVAAKRYKYRERNDPPYNQTTVETVWANYN